MRPLSSGFSSHLALVLLAIAFASGIASDRAVAAGNCGESGCVYGPLHYKNGTIIQNNPKIYAIFWGSNWNSVSPSLRTKLETFYAGLSGSAYQSILTQYFDESGGVSLAVPVTFYTDTSIAAPTAVTKSTVAQEAAKVIQSQQWPKSIESQFIVLTPPGTTYGSGYGTEYCAYHHVSTGQEYVYGNIPYQGSEPLYSRCGAAFAGYPSADDLTVATASHEYAEAVLNTINGEQSWLTTEGRPITHICEVSPSFPQLPNGVVVEELWDNYQNRCSVSDPSPPRYFAITQGATAQTNSTATLNGIVNPEGGSSSKYIFQYGLTTSYGMSTSEISMGTGNVSKAVSASIVGLAPNSLYHFRVVALGPLGPKYGKDVTFTTKGAPSATTQAAVTVTGTDATLRASINPHGANTTYHFEFGETSAYGTSVPLPEASAGSGTSSSGVEKILQNTFAPQKTYHYRVVATNIYGTTYGTDVAFTTLPVSPPIVAVTGSSAFSTSAKLSGSINPQNAETKFYFEYGPTISYGFKSSEAIMPAYEKVNLQKSVSVSKLLPGTTYHFRLVGTNLAGTSKSTDAVFTTTPLWNALGPWVKPPNAYNFYLEGVSCVSTSLCMAVGRNDTQLEYAKYKPFVERWEGGSEWKLVSVPAPMGAESTIPSGISCASAFFCVISGRYKISGGMWLPLVEVWDGVKWSVQAVPRPAEATTSELSGISCVTANGCVAVGNYSNVKAAALPWALQWNGSSWTLQMIPTMEAASASYPEAVSCVPPLTCTAVGSYVIGGEKTGAFWSRWNEVSWNTKAAIAPNGTTEAWPMSVSCVAGSQRCTASGFYRLTSSNEISYALTVEGEAEGWSRLKTAPGTLGSVGWGVSCPSLKRCIAVGTFSDNEWNFGSLANGWWSEQGWLFQAMPEAEPFKKEGWLNGVSCPTEGVCVAVGQRLSAVYR